MCNSVFILGISSDIGKSLARLYRKAGFTVAGTYRNETGVMELKDDSGINLFRLDLEAKDAASDIALALNDIGFTWNLFIASNGTMEPIAPFDQLDPDEWAKSIYVNAIAPAKILNTLLSMRNKEQASSVCYMAGGGTNGTFTNYSAYCLSKILLIKFCELLDDEIPDIKTFIVGPGWVDTKIHQETIYAGENAGKNLTRTLRNASSSVTSMQDIYDCIEWCRAQTRDVISGRNISLVHDEWRDHGDVLALKLKADPDMFKLRRFGN